MRLSLEALQALDAIDRHGSFARAAESLHKVPSALSYTVQKLESDMDVLLFDRSGQRAVLTAIGRALLAEGRELLRQAEGVERRIRNLAQGWEPSLVIAVDNILPLEWLFPVVRQFDALGVGTRLRFTQEILGGVWDALIDRRADLAVAAPGDAPAESNLHSLPWCHLSPFVFAVAPEHPLADAPEPLTDADISRHRAIVVTDSSRRLEARSAGILPGQPTLHVSNLADKLSAQIAGLGVGFLPPCLAADALADGRLRQKQVASVREPLRLHLAWRKGEEGLALKWWQSALQAVQLPECQPLQ